MTTTQVWLAILGMGLVTAITRALFLIGGERMILPERVQRALRYAPAAALAAVVVPDLVETPHGMSLGARQSRALCVACRSRMVFVAPQHARHDPGRHGGLHRFATLACSADCCAAP